jgi:hypothetical protein
MYRHNGMPKASFSESFLEKYKPHQPDFMSSIFFDFSHLWESFPVSENFVVLSCCGRLSAFFQSAAAIRRLRPAYPQD